MNIPARWAPGLLLVIVGCGPTTADVPAMPESTATADSKAAPPPPAPTVAPSAVATAAPAADTRVREACAKLCERVAGSCPKARGDACLAQCASHEARSKGCEAETEAALSCQAKSKESFCDNVVAQACNDAFVRMQRCQKGEAAPLAAGRKTPEGWRRVSDETWGVSMLMPPSAAREEQAKSRTWRATHQGATYEIVEIPRPKKLEEHALIKLVLAHVGISCQKEMRLGGRVDTDKLTFTRFETSCAKGARIYGKLWIDDQRVLSFVVKEESKEENREAFLDSIQ